MPVTLRFQSTGTVPGNAQPVSMRGGSLTVGRALENDLVLPDPDISKEHCKIERQNGQVVLVDLSTNGTFLNYENERLGRAPARLNDGDILTMGAYELLVEVSADIPEDDLLSPPDRSPVRRAANRPEHGEDGLMPPIDEEEDPIRCDADDHAQGASHADHSDAAQDSFTPARSRVFIPEDWDKDPVSGVGSPTGPPGEGGSLPEHGQDAPAEDRVPGAGAADRARHQPSEPTTAPRARAQASTIGDAAARAFLEALGHNRLDVPDEELEETMARLGAVMRTMIEGLREILMTRAALKDEFGIKLTIIGASGNNPLKFSASPDEAIEALVRRRLPGYLQPTEAAQQALDDIKAHEVATVTGMEAALQGILRQLAPEALEGQIRSKGGLADMLKSRKSLYWEAYERLYAQISDQAEQEFHDLFGREFARAYQAQLEKLK